MRKIEAYIGICMLCPEMKRIVCANIRPGAFSDWGLRKEMKNSLTLLSSRNVNVIGDMIYVFPTVDDQLSAKSWRSKLQYLLEQALAELHHQLVAAVARVKDLCDQQCSTRKSTLLLICFDCVPHFTKNPSRST